MTQLSTIVVPFKYRRELRHFVSSYYQFVIRGFDHRRIFLCELFGHPSPPPEQ